MTRKSRLRVEPLEDRLTPAAGDLDPTFGNAGIVTLPPQNTINTIKSVAVAPDGRVLALLQLQTPPLSTVTGYAVERFGPDGSPDSTFGTNGIATIPGPLGTPDQASGFGQPTTVVALPDGRVLVGGSVHIPGKPNSDFAVVRFTATGTVDPTFGTGGTAVTAFNYPLTGNTVGVTVSVGPDGRLIVAGDLNHTTTLDTVPIITSVIGVGRFTADGQPDPTFGTGGTTTVPFPVGRFTNTTATSAAVLSDGRVVLGGSAAVTGQVQPVGPPGNVAWVTQSDPVVVQLTAGGQLDPTFGTGGRVLVPLPGSGDTSPFGTRGLQVLPDGRVLLAADVFTASAPVSYGAAARLTTAGQLDPTFGTGGLAVTAQGHELMGAAIDSLGRAVFSGDEAFRLTAYGTVDTRFGAGGKVVLSSLPGLSTSGMFAPALAVQSDGNVLLGGWQQKNSQVGLMVRLLGNGPPAGFVQAGPGTIAAGGAADGTVQVLTPTNGQYAAAGTVTAFPGLAGNVRSAIADVTGDGTPDYVVGAGPGGAPAVTVFDGKTGNVVADFAAFETSFRGGVFVSAADLDGDGKAEIVAAPDQGGGPRVVIFSVAGGAVTQRASFFGIDDPAFRGGARVALGDVNHDGTPDLAVAAGFLGGPRVALFDGKTLFGTPTRLVNDFFAFPGSDAVNLRNGVFVSIGDVNGDGNADLIFGGGPGGAPRVFVLSGSLVSAGDVAGAQASPVANFFVAGNSADRGGVRVAVTNADGDTKADLAVGSGEGSPGHVRVYLGKDFTTSAEPGTVQDLSVFGGAALPGGVFVG
jgi:uncharacterized delta-60 repeat protein